MTDIPPPGKTHQEFDWHSRALTIISNPEPPIVPPIAPPALAHAIAIMASGFIVRDTRTGEVVVNSSRHVRRALHTPDAASVGGKRHASARRQLSD